MDIARMVAHAVGDAVRRSELEQTRAGQRVLADQLAGLAIGLQENGAAPRSAVPLIRCWRRILHAAEVAQRTAQAEHAARVAARADRP